MLLRTAGLCGSICIPLVMSAALAAQAASTKHHPAKSSFKTVAARVVAPLAARQAAPTAAVPAVADPGTLFRYDSCGCSGG